jgi:lysosomal alpha-mannosidase
MLHFLHAFFVYSDRSEGGGSIHDGSIEIMLHRITLYDDALGVSEPLNEKAFDQGLVVRGKHYLIVESPSSSALYHRVASQQLYMHPLATYALPHLSYANYSATYRQTWSALTKDLPLNVHLLTFDQLDTKQYLVRVENYFEVKEDDTYSRPVTVDLQKLFETQGIISDIVELALGANLALADMKRLEWLTVDRESSKMDVPSKFLELICRKRRVLLLFF